MSPIQRRRTAESSAVALHFSSFLLSAAHADEPGFQAIFNGKDLTGRRLGHTDPAGKSALDDGRSAVKDRYPKAEGLSLSIIMGCVPLDGDTYDVPAIFDAETRRRVHGLPPATYGHREKFGSDPRVPPSRSGSSAPGNPRTPRSMTISAGPTIPAPGRSSKSSPAC